jgi:hypothetical protein
MRCGLKVSALKSFAWCGLPITLAVGASPPARADTAGSVAPNGSTPTRRKPRPAAAIYSASR